MENFRELTIEEQSYIDGGGLREAWNNFKEGWQEFWGGFKEGVEDGYQNSPLT